MITTYMIFSFVCQWALYALMVLYTIRMYRSNHYLIDKIMGFFGAYFLVMVLNTIGQTFIAWLGLQENGGVFAAIAKEMGEVSATAFADDMEKEALFKVIIMSTVGSFVWQTVISVVVFIFCSIHYLLNRSRINKKTTLKKELVLNDETESTPKPPYSDN